MTTVAEALPARLTSRGSTFMPNASGGPGQVLLE
jgi:hypothetical protein